MGAQSSSSSPVMSDGNSKYDNHTILNVPTSFYKKFRACPRIQGKSDEQSTLDGYIHKKCFPVIGHFQVPKGGKVIDDFSDNLFNAVKVDSGMLVPRSLRYTNHRKKDVFHHHPLNEEDFVISSLSDIRFIYPIGKLVLGITSRPRLWFVCV